jgi:hypothetical protein
VEHGHAVGDGHGILLQFHLSKHLDIVDQK